jgi:glycosyltransferase involved in cell wall biosynthesis
MYQALLQSGLEVNAVRARWVDSIARLLGRLLRRLHFKSDITRSVIYASLASLEASIRVGLCKADVIVAVTAATYVFSLRSAKPVIFISDATFACISQIYPDLSNMPRWLKRDADKIERAALRSSKRIIFSSDWAKNSAIMDYQVSPALVRVLPLGPNISSQALAEFEPDYSPDFQDGVRLLFIGADWRRKGGPVVLDIKRNLESRGVPCEVFFVGNYPEGLAPERGVHSIGRLDKSDEKQLQELCRLYQSAHFFVLPTSAEAYGIVFSEAQAFGCPSLTFAVGGTPTAVKNGVTGFTLPITANAGDFADTICSLVRDPRQYGQISHNCRLRYENEANWDVWGKSVLASVEELCELLT